MNLSIDKNIFGAVRMGYAVIESRHLQAWQTFLHQGIGLHLNCNQAEDMSFRMDQHLKRIIVQQGPAEDFVALGWQVKDLDTLNIILARLEERNIPVESSTSEEARHRGVKQFWRIIGPKEQLLELFIEPEVTAEPLQMLSSGFVTGEGGLGQVAITSRQPLKMQRFWQEIFDARVSDYIEEVISGMTLDITFLRLNERHHSVAIATTREVSLDPIRTKVQHMNVQATTLEDLAASFKRCKELGFVMAHEIGQHPNDKELSFYVVTPSGFEIEYGWNPIVVDEDKWQSTKYYGISLWGHKPEHPGKINGLLTNLGNLKQGVRNVLHPEFSPLSNGKN